MNRFLYNTRNCTTYFCGNGARSVRGYSCVAADVIHRCLSTTTGNVVRADSLARTHGRCRTIPHQLPRRRPAFATTMIPPSRQELRVRWFVFDSRKARRTNKRKDPFKVLKIPKESLYKDVKRKFLKIAMSNHPDTHGDGLTEKEKDAMRDRFIEARMAFEMLVEDPEDGTAILVEEKEDRDGNFDSWFRNETGLKNPFDVDIDPETMKEVAEMTEKLGGSQGMDRDGGMWALARMVTSAVKSGGDAASILRLEAGDVKGPGPVPGGKLRRPRRR
mmetsp:Transcript_26155/g.71725  ORF Transcript_26155/g.71725 Transcript_26155/m.71725 type:complete len:275 (+) Transcript_26155:285-1109(+)